MAGLMRCVASAATLDLELQSKKGSGEFYVHCGMCAKHGKLRPDTVIAIKHLKLFIPSLSFISKAVFR